jgi:hypothetical protein
MTAERARWFLLAGLTLAACGGKLPASSGPSWPAHRYEVLGTYGTRETVGTRKVMEQQITVRQVGAADLRVSVRAARESLEESQQVVGNGNGVVHLESFRYELSVKGREEWRLAGSVRRAGLREPYYGDEEIDSRLEDGWRLDVLRDARPVGSLTGGVRHYRLALGERDDRVYVEDFGLTYLLVQEGRVVGVARRSEIVQPRFDLQVRAELPAADRERALNAFLFVSALLDL